MNWRIKGLVQKTLSALPAGMRVNDLLQRTVGGLRHFDEQVASKVSDWTVFIDHLESLSIAPKGLRLVEIGTGWFPTLPLCFSLAGAAACHTFDLNPHLSHRLTRKLLTALSSQASTIAARADRPRNEVESDHKALLSTASLAELLLAARVQYHAPADARRTSLPDESVDVVFSNSVLEHVPGDVIQSMLIESKRILRKGGVTIHCVNCGDHYAYFDRTITPMNYFTFTEEQWRRWNNPLQYQNRLRPIDFVQMAERAGLQLAINCFRPREDLKAVLPKLQITDEFLRYGPEQLCSTSVAFAARRV
jgi:hypothetical protein